jgi:hypothetical protein
VISRHPLPWPLGHRLWRFATPLPQWSPCIDVQLQPLVAMSWIPCLHNILFGLGLQNIHLPVGSLAFVLLESYIHFCYRVSNPWWWFLNEVTKSCLEYLHHHERSVWGWRMDFLPCGMHMTATVYIGPKGPNFQSPGGNCADPYL